MPHRLYILLNTTLNDASRLSEAPRPGDVVCFLRRAQDPEGKSEAWLRDDGIDVIFVETLFDESTNRAINAVGMRFLHEWYRDGGVDFSSLGDVSLGTAYSMELARQINPRVIIRFGEIPRRLADRYPGAKHVLSDVRDGDGIFEVEPDYLPLRRALAQTAERRGLSFQALEPVDPIPHAMRRVRHSNWTKTLKSLAGRFRPVWLTARRRLRRNAHAVPGQPMLYMILGRGQEPVARRIAARGRLHVVCSRLGVESADAARGDQLFALPRLADIARARKLLRRLTALSRQGAGDRRYVFEGWDYGPILYCATRGVIASQLWSFLIVVAQSRKLHRTLGYDALFVAGAGAEFMGNLVSLDRQSGRRVYLMPHGMNLHRSAYPMPASDHRHVTYLAFGADHTDFYVSDGGSRQPVRTVLVGNPLTATMNETRRASSVCHRQRLLILSFGHLEFWNADRIYACDRYYAEVFSVARDLIAEGWSIGIRAHPYHPHALEERIIASLGLGDAIRWDDHQTFEEALTQYDVVVSNASSACYQALYAGWPTIFYEPNYREVGKIEGLDSDPMLTGLVTAKDIDRPVTNDPEVLARMIRESRDPTSVVSTFPERFVGELAHRFIGPDAAGSDEIAADFLENDILGTACAAPEGAPIAFRSTNASFG